MTQQQLGDLTAILHAVERCEGLAQRIDTGTYDPHSVAIALTNCAHYLRTRFPLETIDGKPA